MSRVFRSPGFLRLLRVGFSLAVLVALVVVVVQAVRDASSFSLRIHAGWLILAWPLAVASFPLLAVSWSQLLAAYGHRLGVPTAVRLWCLAQASRYLPTGLVAVASRAVLAARYGVPRPLSVMTMAIEGALLVAWSGLAAAALLFTGGRLEVIPLAVGGLVGLVAVPVGLRVAGRLGRSWSGEGRVAQWLVRATRRASPPAMRSLLVGESVVGLSLAVKSLVFLLFVKALLPVHASDVALVIGAMNVAVVAGLIGVTPAGLGVREAVLVGILGHRFGVANVTAMALFARVWDLSVELPWIAGSVIANRRASR